MSAPQPPVRTSRTVVIVCGLLAVLLAAVVIAVAAVGVYEWATSPIVPPVEHGPIPARSAPPAPITPPVLRECPINGCGPR